MVRAFPDSRFATVDLQDQYDRGTLVRRTTNCGEQVYVLPLVMPEEGGHIWVEVCDGDHVVGEIVQHTDLEGQVHVGCVHQLRRGVPFAWWHCVTEWRKRRAVLVAYSSGVEQTLNQGDIKKLETAGFPIFSIEEEYYPQFNMMQLVTENLGSVHDGVQDSCDPSKAEDAGNEVEPFLDETDDVVNLKFGELWLALEEGEPLRGCGRVQLVSTALDFDAGMFKTEVSYTYGVENLLEQLQGPLAIVHTVHPREVEENFEKWRGVIVKEIGAIEHATVPLPEGSEVRERWLKQDKCQILPMKLVYTVKPPQGDDPRAQAEKFRRKARIVLCGNMADADAAEVYAATAPAEVVRATLIHAAKANWQVAVLDITSAFLQTPLEAIQDAPVVVAAPPKILETQGLVAPRTLWGITHAVYGLRQSPKLWGAFRDMTVKDMTFDLEDGTYRLRQGRVENTWWSLEREGGGPVKAIMVIYVDDFLIAGDVITIEKVAEKSDKLGRLQKFRLPNQIVRFVSWA